MKSLTIDSLKKVHCLRDLPEDQLQWLISHGEYFEYDDGTVLTKTGDPIDHLWFIIEGTGSFYMDIHGRMAHYYNFNNSPETGGVGGLLPYSRLVHSPGFTYAQENLKVLLIHKSHFPQMEVILPLLKQRLIGYLTERARYFATQILQQEKISALGKLAAGIAHELNNPAAAINRLASVLRRRIASGEELTMQLLDKKVHPNKLGELKNKMQQKVKEFASNMPLTALQRIEREEELENWLVKNGISKSRQVSESFTAAYLTIEELEEISNNAKVGELSPLLLWLENQLNFEWLLKELETSSEKISFLVGSIKNHVQMDRSHSMTPTDLHHDLDNTLTLFGYKIREKNITVIKHYHNELPKIEAFVGELNQVWSNLIDNAIQALQDGGELLIETDFQENEVIVKIEDNGPGISDETMPFIFDPYFTTKKADQGTGLGLDIVKRVVSHHRGNIHPESGNGRTVFTVKLPVTQQNAHEPFE